jgi:hypothetical protein
LLIHNAKQPGVEEGGMSDVLPVAPAKGWDMKKLSAERKQRSIKLVRKADRRRKVRKAKIN